MAIASAVVASAVIGAVPRKASAILPPERKCQATLRLFADHTKLTLAHRSKWDTDTWAVHPPNEILPAGKSLTMGRVGHWDSRGGLFRGCHNDIRYDTHGHGTLEFTMTKHYNGDQSFDCRNLKTGESGCHEVKERSSHTTLSVNFVVNLP